MKELPNQHPEDSESSVTPPDLCKSVKAAPVDPADIHFHTVRAEFVSRGPYEVKSDFNLPKREEILHLCTNPEQSFLFTLVI